MTKTGSTRSPGAVLFDIDGTLVDSSYLHISAWLHALRAVGHPVDAWRIHRGQGMGSSELLAALLGEVSDEVSLQAKQHHSERYRQSSELLRAFDGARDLVAEVAQRGVIVVLATSAAPEELELLRSVLGIEDAVAEITAAQDVEAAKPEPDLIQVALQQAGVTADRAVYVGDTVWDVKACGKAGVACVGVLSGGVSAAELIEAGAVAVYEDCRALLRELDTSPLAALWS
ncbi:MAG: HAD family hydrolase [Pseudonocardiales bacterium]|nr:HAD family hydrolase [Pseudonocardiales bacterium]MBV9728154.1 HAD family hydrolase [Pseudonocardiales bacterium]